MKDNKQPKELKAGIYWLPNVLTTSSLFSAFYAIVSALRGDFEYAAIAIFIAMIFDTLDGRVARMTGSSSDFGAEYDSLVDVVSFGVAPALLVYIWSLNNFGRFGWLASFIYLACTALRLARFNSKLESNDKKFFEGLPCPASAAVITSFVCLCCSYDIMMTSYVKWIILVLTVMVAGLQISNFRYYSFKELELKGKLPYVMSFVNVLLFIAIAIDPPLVLFVVFFLYALSGIVLTCTKKRSLRKLRKKESTK